MFWLVLLEALLQAAADVPKAEEACETIVLEGPKKFPLNQVC